MKIAAEKSNSARNIIRLFPRNPGAALLLILLISVSNSFAQQKNEPLHDATVYSFESIEKIYYSGDIEIAATLLLPEVGGPVPAAVLIQGAGDSSRKNFWALQIGSLLAERGIAIFLPDKRGSGDSEGDWKKANFAELAEDIKAAVKYLTTQEEIDSTSIGVVGLSQGGFYAPLVANESENIAFVGAVSASVMTLEETINHEMKNTFYQDGLNGKAFEQAMAVQLAAIQFARDKIWENYEKTRNEALLGEASSAAEGFPSEIDHWLWNWIRGIIDFDPMIHWINVNQPIFFAYGRADEDDNVPVVKSAELIRSRLSPNKDIMLRIYPESGHALYDPVQAKEGKGVVLSDFVEDLAGWILLKSENDKHSE